LHNGDFGIPAGSLFIEWELRAFLQGGQLQYVGTRSEYFSGFMVNSPSSLLTIFCQRNLEQHGREIWTLLRLCNLLSKSQLQVAKAVRSASHWFCRNTDI